MNAANRFVCTRITAVRLGAGVDGNFIARQGLLAGSIEDGAGRGQRKCTEPEYDRCGDDRSHPGDGPLRACCGCRSVNLLDGLLDPHDVVRSEVQSSKRVGRVGLNRACEVRIVGHSTQYRLDVTRRWW